MIIRQLNYLSMISNKHGYLISFPSQACDHSQLEYIGQKHTHRMCQLHKVYHQSQMHSEDSKLMSLERDKKACNDLFHELQKMKGRLETS